MLTAIKDNETIFVYQHNASELKEWSNDNRLRCPDCQREVIFKQCEGKQSHFAHVSKDCSYPYREPESLEHEKGKLALFRWLSLSFGTSCTTEYHIHQTNQRSDLYLTEHQTAIEFQCSPLSSATWQKRHALYQEAGICDFWILGFSMHTLPYPHNPYIHHLNALEQTLLEAYGKLFYYDVLTNQFIVILPHNLKRNHLYGVMYAYKTSECFFDEKQSTLTTKYDYFMVMQSKRTNRLFQSLDESEKTDKYLQQVKTKSSTGKQTLATKKQTDFIQALLKQKKMTIPYKLHGLLQHEASTIISELLGNGHKKKKTP